ncbi:MAG: hypothetical protein NW226_21745 [Microscillaceae bacterium]|nr:hypothetical protein [Microscillaceae bacterium]
MKTENIALTKAQESRNAIERLYIEMRHLFNRGVYKPSGITGNEVRASLRTLSPEIYGSMNDPRKVELNGIVYVMDRLPKGIEECSFIKFTSEEGFEESNFEPIIPLKRRRNCYRIDKKQVNIEVTRGRSEIYDALTHLTFLFNEAEKIRKNAYDEDGKASREWNELEKIVIEGNHPTEQTIDKAFTYLSTILGRTFEETKQAYHRLAENPGHNNGLFNIVYWLGKLASTENSERDIHDREISFTPTLRERIGRHIHGERWAANIKKTLLEAGLIDRPIHIISANLHSVINCLYAYPALKESFEESKNIEQLATELSKEENDHLRDIVDKYARSHGMIFLPDSSGTNLSVQIIDTSKLIVSKLPPEIHCDKEFIREKRPIIVVMDYAFGEQAYETMDELLKPLTTDEEPGSSILMPIESISIMGKAGILEGGKGDIMIPTAHVFEGTADNYPFQNEFSKEDFAEMECCVCVGPMITVLGTSLQNRDVLSYFKNSSWQAIGLEMEGAHYQKAIQAETMIRKNISQDIVLRYAYYASDNPLETGSTLASGSLGLIGIKPTYLITRQILNKILKPKNSQISEGKNKKKPESVHHNEKSVL